MHGRQGIRGDVGGGGSDVKQGCVRIGGGGSSFCDLEAAMTACEDDDSV